MEKTENLERTVSVMESSLHPLNIEGYHTTKIRNIPKYGVEGKRLRKAIIRALHKYEHMTSGDLDREITQKTTYADIGNELEVAFCVGRQISHLKKRHVLLEKKIKCYEGENFIGYDFIYRLNSKKGN